MCNLGTRLALVVGMESTKNDKQNPTEMDGQSADGAGLSSAMHDIRMLAARYESESQEMQAGDSLRLAGVSSLQPNHILQPEPAKTSDRWKGPALMLLMLLGLSTSALALSLYAEPDSLVEPVFFENERFGHGSPALMPTIELPNEEPRYEVTTENTSPETAMRTPAKVRTSRIKRAAVAPLVTKRIHTEAPSRVEESFTCDEVACLIDSSDPCCSQYPSVRQQESQIEDHSPYRPTRSSVMKAMRGIEDDVMGCFETYGESGLASVDFVIQTDGTVREIELSQGALTFRACIRKHVRSLKFEELRAPFRMSFPFRK